MKKKCMMCSRDMIVPHYSSIYWCKFCGSILDGGIYHVSALLLGLGNLLAPVDLNAVPKETKCPAIPDEQQ